jgi:hypothetical protein
MEKRTIVTKREILADGVIQIQMQKQIVDGDEIHIGNFVRTIVLPGQDIDEVVGVINTFLVNENSAVLDSEEIDKLQRTVAGEHTEKVVSMYRATILQQAEEQLKMEANTETVADSK